MHIFVISSVTGCLLIQEKFSEDLCSYISSSGQKLGGP